MARRLVVQPQSDLDIQAAAVWYEDQQSGLGASFLNELDQVFLRIVDNPRQFPRVEDEVHRALLRHFPYGVYITTTISLHPSSLVVHSPASP